ncbi:MAG: hypothetical protein LBK71_00385, partial [Verrucomicrobiales bacterium]|nr:hypothetical protein [Verrucomicrobiales bacterium]
MKKTTLLLTILSVLTLTTQAAYLVVDGSSLSEANADYIGPDAAFPALLVTNQGYYSGTDGVYTGTYSYPTPGGYGVYVNGTSRADLYGGTASASSNYKAAVAVTENSTVNLQDLHLSVTGAMANALILVNATANIRNVWLTAYNYGDGVNGSGARLAGELTGTGLHIDTYGDSSYGIFADSGATFDLTDVAITTTGSRARGIQMINGASGTIRNLAVTTDGLNAQAILFERPDSSLTVIGGTLQTHNADGVAMSAYTNGDNQRLNLTDVDIIAASAGLVINANSSEVHINGGSIKAGSALINASGTGQNEIFLDQVQTANGDDAVIAGGSVTLTMHTSDMNIGGDLSANDNANLTLSGSNGTTITGTVSGNDNAIIDLTVSGPGSTILGDITQSGSSAVTVIIDNSATGQGGYNGGNLITGEDSTWTFNKDSHGN